MSLTKSQDFKVLMIVLLICSINLFRILKITYTIQPENSKSIKLKIKLKNEELCTYTKGRI